LVVEVAESKPGASYAALMAKANDLRKGDPKLTEAQAFTKAYTDPANRDLVAQYKREDAQRKEEAVAKMGKPSGLKIPDGYSGSPTDVNGDPEDDDGLMSIWNKYGLKVDYAAITAVRNWAAQNAQAPAPTGVGKGSLYRSGQLASARLSDKASALATATGIDHPSALARVRAANPLLATAADAEVAANQAA
jgi:hypothetical protein